MDKPKACPFCGSARIQRREALFRIRAVRPPEGGPAEDCAIPVYRCSSCGRGFDELEAQDPAAAGGAH